MIYHYDHPEKFFNWEKIDFSQYSGNLILWGAGRIGGVAAHCLKKQGIEFLAYCDIATDKWGTTFCGHKVISPEDLKLKYPDAAVIISNVFHNTVYQQLRENGFFKIFDCSSLFMEIDFDGYDFWMQPEYAIRNVEQYLAAILEQVANSNEIDQIFLNITTKCTLRCRHCSLFIPYVSSPCNYEAATIMADLYKVLNVLKHVRIINFYGGEPLMHPELPSMIRQLAQERRIDRISVITNGTIMPGEELLSAMKAEKRFLVRISDYGTLSSKLDEIRETLEKNHIQYEVANYSYWDRPSKIKYMDCTEEELTAKFKLCTACNVLFMLNSKIYLCSTGSAVCNLGVFPESQNNYVDLSSEYESEDMLQQIISDFIARPKQGDYLDACRYCSGNHCVQFENKVPVAEQAKGPLTFGKLY